MYTNIIHRNDEDGEYRGNRAVLVKSPESVPSATDSYLIASDHRWKQWRFTFWRNSQSDHSISWRAHRKISRASIIYSSDEEISKSQSSRWMNCEKASTFKRFCYVTMNTFLACWKCMKYYRHLHETLKGPRCQDYVLWLWELWFPHMLKFEETLLTSTGSFNSCN